jgi:hypothetical protein
MSRGVVRGNPKQMPERVQYLYDEISHLLHGGPHDICLSLLITLLVFGLTHEGRPGDYTSNAEETRAACLELSQLFADRPTRWRTNGDDDDQHR